MACGGDVLTSVRGVVVGEMMRLVYMYGATHYKYITLLAKIITKKTTEIS